jgi:DNA-binding response OmpR family regulator
MVLGRVRVDASARTVEVRGRTTDWQVADLTRTQTDVVLALAARPGCAVSRDTILNAVWGEHRAVQPHVLDTMIYKIRKRLGPARAMLNAVKAGYRLGPRLPARAARS